MCEKTSMVNIGFSRERFPAGTHICLVFRDESERKKIVSKFVESGILEGEKVFYFADTADPSEVISWLEEMEISVAEAITSASFCVDHARNIYCPANEFIPEQMYKTLESAYRESLTSGYPNARVTGEMSWALCGITGSERLMEYESGVNTVLESCPITAMCQYDANKFSGSLIYQALEVHPYMVMNGQLVRNPYFIAGER